MIRQHDLPLGCNLVVLVAFLLFRFVAYRQNRRFLSARFAKTTLLLACLGLLALPGLFQSESKSSFGVAYFALGLLVFDLSTCIIPALSVIEGLVLGETLVRSKTRDTRLPLLHFVSMLACVTWVGAALLVQL